MPHAYFAFGLRIQSDIPLPELTGDAGGGICDVRICLGAVPDELADARYRDAFIQIGAEDTLVTIAGVARYHVHAGCRITIAPFPGAADHDVRVYLLGSIWGVICHERRLMPLHANAIDMNGRVMAFAGHSGAGKSTLAAAFEDRGYDVLSDDICAVSFADGKPPLAWPGIPRVRLWRDTAEALGRDVEKMQIAADARLKYQIPIAHPAPRHGLPLARIYVLEDGCAAPEISRMPVSEALGAIMMHTYRSQYLNLAGKTVGQFARNAQLLAHVPVFRLSRRKDFKTFQADVTRLEAHMLAGGAADRDSA